MSTGKEYAVYFSRDGVHWHTGSPVQFDAVRSLMRDEELMREWASSRLGVQSRRGFYAIVVEMVAGWFREDWNCTVGQKFFSLPDIRRVPPAELQPQFGFEERNGALYISELDMPKQDSEFVGARL